MSVKEQYALDMAAVLLGSYELGDMIKNSAEVAEYLRAKRALENDEQAQALIRGFRKKKELFEECQRFGHFHPDYHAALDQVGETEREMERQPSIRGFKLAENELDELLYEVSKLIAHSVSESVKVPSNNVIDEQGGCSSGGSCSGRCGSC